MPNRAIAVLAAAALLLGAAPKKHATAHKSVGKQVLPIALILNGSRLSVNPAPINYRGRLLVPVRRILTSLGLDFDRQGSTVVTHVGAETIAVTGGIEIKNTLYAPLRFFTEALKAQAVFNRQTNSVEILSTLVGQTGDGNEGGGMSGTLTAIDTNSDPQTVTISHNASVRTLSIRTNVNVIVQDVNTGTSNPGTLQDVHVGDYAEVHFDRGGSVKQIVDAYGSRTGKVAGYGAGSIVLDDGHVIVPSRATTITLNGATATIDKIAVGDSVMVRYNIDSSETREIIATRPSAGLPRPQSGPAISSIAFSPQHPLKAGDVMDVTLNGTAGGGVAHYDIGPYVRNVGLHESSPGVYTGSYTVKRNENFADAPLFGHLTVDGTDAPVTESSATLSVATEPPGIVDSAPDNGDTVNNVRPAVYATFVAGTVPVNVSSERILINGHDVTSSSVRSARFIEYIPGVDIPAGPVRVSIEIADQAGNRAVKTWAFTVKP
ncbi:MAG TPA: hypothetical protein VFL13_08180 [Candidatus Baltobacteraceae bacterium]|nr:hypothetical protein [Candidatus Baltobacteraceae bacterium]